MVKGDADAWQKLIDIKEFPDLGGAPDLLDTTTLSDRAYTYIKGIQSQDALEFTANYTEEDFTALDAYEDTRNEYAVWFGGTEANGVVTPTGEDGKFPFTGQLSHWVVGGGVDEVVDMGISIAPNTPVTHEVAPPTP